MSTFAGRIAVLTMNENTFVLVLSEIFLIFTVQSFKNLRF